MPAAGANANEAACSFWFRVPMRRRAQLTLFTRSRSSVAPSSMRRSPAELGVSRGFVVTGQAREQRKSGAPLKLALAVSPTSARGSRREASDRTA